MYITPRGKSNRQPLVPFGVAYAVCIPNETTVSATRSRGTYKASLSKEFAQGSPGYAEVPCYDLRDTSMRYAELFRDGVHLHAGME